MCHDEPGLEESLPSGQGETPAVTPKPVGRTAEASRQNCQRVPTEGSRIDAEDIARRVES